MNFVCYCALARSTAKITRQSKFGFPADELCIRRSSTKQHHKNPSYYCIELLRKYDYENYLSLLLLPNSIRRTAFAIRAFNIELSQIKDMISTKVIGDMRIQFWRDALENIYSGKPPHQPVALELHRAVKNSNLSKHWLKRLIDCRGSRLNDQPFQSIQEIENYSENSVASVYYLLLETLNLKNVHADHVASHLGKAQGLTNFIRGIPYHLKKQIVILPTDVMIKHNLSQEQVLRGLNEEQFHNVVFDIATVAHHHVKMARDLHQSLPPTSYLVFLPLVSTDEYLIALEKANFNPFHSKLQLRNPWISYKLWWSKFRKRY